MTNPIESQIDDFIEKLVSIETESRLVLDDFSKSKKLLPILIVLLDTLKILIVN